MTEVARGTTASGPSSAVPASASHGTPSGKPAKHYHHGRTPAAWAGATVAFIGVLIGAIGMFFVHINWTLFWTGLGVFVLGGVVAVVMRKLGYGAD